MNGFASFRSFFIFLFLFLLTAFPTASSAKSPHSVKLGAQLGTGYDSNVFNKKNPANQALTEEASAKVGYGFKASKRLKFNLDAGAGDSYRFAGGNATALKLNVKGKTGVAWKVFGAKSSKKHFLPNGTLVANFGYSGTFNPTLTSPSENVDVIDEEDEVDDATFEDDLTGGEDDTFAEESDGFDDDWTDEGEYEEDETEEDAEDFFEEDPIGNKFFNSKPPRHAFTGTLNFAYNPWRKIKFTLCSQGSVNNVGETPGRVSSDAKGAGGGLKVSYELNKRVTFDSGYNLGLKWFDEKTTAAGDALRMVAHGIAVGAKLKPNKRLKVTPSYRFGLTTVPPNSAADSRFHQLRLGFDVKMTKWLSLFEETNVLFSGLTANGTKDARRLQALLGVRGSVGWPKKKK
jgi:hypothetical protein